MLPLAGAADGAGGRCVWAGDSAGGPALGARAGGRAAAGAAEADRTPARTRPPRAAAAAALAFHSDPRRPDGWAQPP